MGHLSSVYCVCFDQTGQYIFTGADDHLIKIWSARDGRLIQTLRGHGAEITDLSVNYENRLLASGSNDRIIRIWDLKTSKLLDCLNGHSAVVTSVKFAPYNRHHEGYERYLISTSNDGSVIFWTYNVKTLQFKKLKKFMERNRPGGRIVCSSFSTGGSFLACGSSDHCIHVYGFHPYNGPYPLDELKVHRDRVDSIQFCNLGFRFISGSVDGTAIIWNYKQGKFRPLKLNMSTPLDQNTPEYIDDVKKLRVLIVQWSHDDRNIMTSVADFSIKIWDSKTGDLLHVLREHKQDVYLIESHPLDPRIFASASHDGTIIIWDVERAKVLKKFLNKGQMDTLGSACISSIFDIKFSPDGNMIAATDNHGFLSIYGNGGSHCYAGLPDQLFFHTDYRPLIRDMRQFVLDEQSHVAPHLMPRPTLVDMNGDPYPQSLQSLVPNHVNGERIVIPPLSDAHINNIAQMIINHSLFEDDEFLDLSTDTLTDISTDESTEEYDSETTEIYDDDETVIDSDSTIIYERPRRKAALRSCVAAPIRCSARLQARKRFRANTQTR